MLSYKKKKETFTEPLSEEQFYRLLRSKRWNENIDKFRQTGEDRYKSSLPAICFQAWFDESDKMVTDKQTGKKRKVRARWSVQKCTHLTGLVVLDIDHVENPEELINGKWRIEDGKLVAREEWVATNHYPLTTIQSALSSILLVFITPSGKGLKVVFKARMEWGNLADNQIEMANILGVQLDESGKDASRIAFICKEEDIKFIDKEIFTYEDKKFAEKYNGLYRNGHSNPINHNSDGSIKPNTGNSMASQEDRQVADGSREENSQPNEERVTEPCFKGKPYSEIIEAWWKQQGGVPQEGERNVKLYQLAVNLRAICDNNRALLQEIMPRLGLDEQEFQSIIDSACKEQPKGISKPLRELLDALGVANDNAGDDGKQLVVNGKPDDDINAKLWHWGDQIEALFEPFPILRDICKGLKKNQYPSAVFVGGLLFMTLMTRCTYRFYHRPEELRRLNGSVIIEGDPACGKSFATRLYKLLMAPVFMADKIGRDAINAYRELLKTKGANKEKPKKPKVVIRVHPARTSNAQFIQDMVNAVEEVDGEEMQLHMITFDTELDNTVCLQKGGSWIDKLSLELKAFHNEEDGQAYSNVDSVIQDFIVTWNYIYTGTPLALKKKVNERNFGSGLATRLTCIPLPSTNFEMMERETVVDYDSDNRLKEWAFLLDKTKGELSVQKIVDELYDWTARRMADAQENDSRADEMLLKRCAYHGLNFSVPFIVMRHWNELHQDGDFWCGAFETDDVDWQLAELLVNIQYACQKHYFGAMAEKYFDDKTRDAVVNRQRHSKTIESFNRLPDEFTVDDVVRCFGLSINASRTRANRLVKDGLAKKMGDTVKDGHAMTLYNKTGALMLG